MVQRHSSIAAVHPSATSSTASTSSAAASLPAYYTPTTNTEPSSDNPSSDGSLSPLEASVLNEYVRLASNFDQLANIAHQLSNLQPEILESIRPLEARLGLVLTLFKASVWATFVAKEAEATNPSTAISSSSSAPFNDYNNNHTHHDEDDSFISR